MAAFTTLLFAAGAGLQAAGTIQQGRIADAEGRAAQKFAERNAQVLEQDAKARREKARFDSIRQARAARRLLGKQTVRAAASGARLDVGAPLLALTEQAEELELENILIGFEGATEAARLEDRAAITRVQGRFARFRGKQARRASFVGAGSSLLTNFATGRSLGII